MNRHPIADLARSLRNRPSRRDLVHGLMRLGLGLGLVGLPDPSAAKKKRKKHKKRKKSQVAFNAFGCVDVGRFCKTNQQCCSGICAGKKDKKTCQAHGNGDGACQPGADFCAADPLVSCTTETGEGGACGRTTGNAFYCLTSLTCVGSPCQKDVDCQELCGPRAACLVCDGNCTSGRTVCVGPSPGSCIQP